MNTIVALDGVTKRYGKLTALENATLTLGAGEAWHWWAIMVRAKQH